MSKKPVIGITPALDEEKDRIFLSEGYANGILKAGGIPFILALTEEDACINAYIALCDGFLISGGPDLDAAYFGEDNLSYNGRISPDRDKLEMKLIPAAVAANKPMFGICRGCQVINVAMGGTLYQDLKAQMPESSIMHNQNAPVWYPIHRIRIEENTHLKRIFKESQISVNSFHHQAIRDVAPQFRVTAMAKDGVIEAIEHISKPFVLGVQWHPELMWQKDESFLNLFCDLVSHCSST